MEIFSLSFLISCCLGLSPFLTLIGRSTPSRGKETTSNDVRVIKNKPHIFVSFEREGKIDPLNAGQSDGRVWLRFHNNSRWTVMFCSGAVPKEYGEAEIQYEIERYRGSGDTPDTSSSDNCVYLLVRPGRSVVFSVPREHLAAGLAVRIPFRYKWETDSDGSDNLNEPKHFAYFYSEDLPNGGS